MNAPLLCADSSCKKAFSNALSSEPHFHIVECNTANDYAEGLNPRSGLRCGENPCFRFILAEHF